MDESREASKAYIEKRAPRRVTELRE